MPGGPQHRPRYPPPFQQARPPAAAPPGYGHVPPAVGPYAGPTGAYAPYHPSAPYDGERVVIDVSRSNARHLIVGALIGAVLGFPAVVAAIVGLADADSSELAGLLVMLVIGLALSAMPVITIARAKVLFRKYRLVFEAPGLRWDDPHGMPWSVPWRELASVLVHGHVTKGGNAREPMVFLHLYPADPNHALRHPEMAHLWDTDGDRGAYRVQLSFSRTYIPQLDAALKRFAPGVYRGVALSDGAEIVPVGDRYQGVREAG